MSSSSATEGHALAILERHDMWKSKRIQESGKYGGKFLAITPKFLYYLIVESQKLGGSVLDQFWHRLGACDICLKENIESLKAEAFVSAQRSFEVLFLGLDPENIDFEPVITMAAEFFAHLGVVLMNPARRKSGTSTEYSVSDAVKESTAELFRQVHQEGVSTQRKQAFLNALSFQRDGALCLLTYQEFTLFDDKGVDPVLAHIIPNSVGRKETLDYVAMFAGPATAEEVVTNLNEIGNFMNMEVNAYSSYNKMKWGIEATEEAGEVKYFFRRIPTPLSPNDPSPGFITLREGDQIHFATGPEGKKLGNGPIPRLCNLHLAVARVLKMSSAADIILECVEAADDEGGYHLFVADEEYCDMLDAKLLLSGRAVVTC